MSDLARAADHQAFLIDRAGDLLIVTPVGDPIEFGINQVQTEFNRVKKLAARSEFRNVLVDMSNSSYFGSEMIGMLLDLRRSVAADRGQTVSDDQPTGGNLAEGGVTALCGLSPDMAAGLKIMNVDTLLLSFDTRTQAVRTLARQTLWDRVRQNKHPWLNAAFLVPIFFLFVALLMIPLLSNLTQPTASSDFETVTAVYERWSLKRKRSLSPEEASRALKPMLEELGTVEQHIAEVRATAGHKRVKRSASHLAKWMVAPKNASAKQSFVDALAAARDKLAEETGEAPAIPEDLRALVDERSASAKSLAKKDPESENEPTGDGSSANPSEASGADESEQTKAGRTDSGDAKAASTAEDASSNDAPAEDSETAEGGTNVRQSSDTQSSSEKLQE